MEFYSADDGTIRHPSTASATKVIATISLTAEDEDLAFALQAQELEDDVVVTSAVRAVNGTAGTSSGQRNGYRSASFNSATERPPPRQRRQARHYLVEDDDNDEDELEVVTVKQNSKKKRQEQEEADAALAAQIAAEEQGLVDQQVAQQMAVADFDPTAFGLYDLSSERDRRFYPGPPRWPVGVAGASASGAVVSADAALATMLFADEAGFMSAAATASSAGGLTNGHNPYYRGGGRGGGVGGSGRGRGYYSRGRGRGGYNVPFMPSMGGPSLAAAAMASAQIGDSYEELLALDETIQRRGLSTDQLDQASTIQVLTEADATRLEKCVVCLENYAANDVVRRLPCLCVFHQACVDQHIQHNTTCPICRADVREASSARV